MKKPWVVGLAALLCIAAAVVSIRFLSDRRGRSKPERYVPQDVPDVLGVSTPTIQQAIAARVDQSPPEWVSRERWERVRTLYRVYESAPLWLEPEGVKDRASALLDALAEAGNHALRTDAYPIDSIRHVVDAKRIDSAATPADIANADVLLTAAYVGYASDMLVGQVDPRTVSQSWHIPARRAAVDSALLHTLQDSSIADGLRQMAPQDSEYVVLMREYAHYRDIVAKGGWPDCLARRQPRRAHRATRGRGLRRTLGRFALRRSRRLAAATQPRRGREVGPRHVRGPQRRRRDARGDKSGRTSSVTDGCRAP